MACFISVRPRGLFRDGSGEEIKKNGKKETFCNNDFHIDVGDDAASICAESVEAFRQCADRELP